MQAKVFDRAVLDALVVRAFGGPPEAVEPMVGGASSRKYFRVTAPGGTKAVVMFVPDGLTPEEASKETNTRWPFLEVHELLTKARIDVPRIYADASQEGYLLLEDLGDRTLAQVLEKDPSQKDALYKQAVADLVAAQLQLAPLSQGTIVATRRFDEELLRWEIDHFREWALEARGVTLPTEARARFDRLATALAREVAAMPTAVVHRDYQSRNLMVREDGRIVWIDFQDALIGPRVYDLVALLNDSYQTFEPAFVGQRIVEAAEAQGLRPDVLAFEFHLVTVQRKLKDAGRFVFIDRVKGNPNFLPFVEPTLKKVRRSMAAVGPKHPVVEELASILDPYLPADD
jgi:aminoglycoside/choline kinase family phosphotransferase